MTHIIIKWILNGVVLIVAANFVPGVSIKNFWAALGVALVVGLLNTFLKPILELFSLPLIVLTMGLFYLVINALILIIASAIVPGFNISSFSSAIIFAVILSIFSWILNIIF